MLISCCPISLFYLILTSTRFLCSFHSSFLFFSYYEQYYMVASSNIILWLHVPSWVSYAKMGKEHLSGGASQAMVIIVSATIMSSAPQPGHRVSYWLTVFTYEHFFNSCAIFPQIRWNLKNGKQHKIVLVF